MVIVFPLLAVVIGVASAAVYPSRNRNRSEFLAPAAQLDRRRSASVLEYEYMRLHRR